MGRDRAVKPNTVHFMMAVPNSTPSPRPLSPLGERADRNRRFLQPGRAG
jgi:hypothetical protein